MYATVARESVYLTETLIGFVEPYTDDLGNEMWRPFAWDGVEILETCETLTEAHDAVWR